MSDVYRIVRTETRTDAALAYLRDSLGCSRILNVLGTHRLQSECASVSLVTAVASPPTSDFYSGCGGLSKPCDEWLVNECLAHLRNSDDALLVFEDIVSSPRDAYLNSRAHPDFWSYDDKVFWPVPPEKAKAEAIEQAMSWAASRRTIAFFTELPRTLRPPRERDNLPSDVFNRLSNSVRRIVTDVFDGEGYIDWRRTDAT